MWASFIEAAKTVGTERLQDADINVRIVMLEEFLAVDVGVFSDRLEIVIEELLAEFGRQICFGIEEERSEIVLQSTFAAALIIQKVGLAAAEHDVAGLKVAIKKIVAVGGQQEFGEPVEIVFEKLFVEGNSRQAKEIILEIVQVPDDGLSVKAAARITDGIVEIAARFDLKTWQGFDDFAIDVDDFG